MELTYRQKQQLLVSYRSDGYELEVKLNVKSTVLDAEIARIELMMDESVITEDITLEDLEASQLHYETILPSSTVVQEVESTVLANQESSPLVPLTILVGLLMVILVPSTKS